MNYGTVDKNIPIPLYYQIKQIVLDEIRSGNLQPGDMLPPEMDLQEIYGVSITTVRQAMKELVMEGYVYRVKSKGTFVSTPKIPQLALAKLGSFREEMKEQGFTPGIEVLKREVQPCSAKIAEKLRVPEKSDIYHSITLRLADNMPILLEEMYLRADWININEFDLRSKGFYDILSQEPKTTMARSERTIESRLATDRDHKFLKVRVGSPIQEITIHDFNKENDPYLYGILSYRGDKNKFSVTLIPNKSK